MEAKSQNIKTQLLLLSRLTSNYCQLKRLHPVWRSHLIICNLHPSSDQISLKSESTQLWFGTSGSNDEFLVAADNVTASHSST